MKARRAFAGAVAGLALGIVMFVVLETIMVGQHTRISIGMVRTLGVLLAVLLVGLGAVVGWTWRGARS